MALEFVSLNTIIHDLLYIIRGSQVVGSESISFRQVENWIHQYRGVLIKQDIDKGKTPNPDYCQTIQCIKMDIVDKADSSNVSINKHILRSNVSIPRTIDFNFRPGFMYIGTLDGKEIQFIPESRVRWQSDKYYTSNQPISYLRDGYLFIENDYIIEYITVRGVFELPQELSQMVNPLTNIPAFNMDSKYPIPITMLPTLKDMIIRKELGVMVNSPADTKNESINTAVKDAEDQKQ